MKLLYPQEHFACFNYEKGQNSQLEILKRSAGESIIRDLVDTEIVFVIDGHFTLSYGKFIDLDIVKGKILFFPPGSHVNAKVLEDTHIIVCRIRGVVQLCDCLPLEHLYRQHGSKKNDHFHMLEINDRVNSYIENFVNCVNDGLKCSSFFSIKMKELFFLLRAYYDKDDLADFFAPLVGKDAQFMNLMYQNYRNVKSVHELADLSMYSSSGFKKQFNRVFGTSASEWLSDQKARLIFQDLNHSKLSIKELADKYDFSSVSSFSNFCLNKFGKTPGKIRPKSVDKEKDILDDKDK